MGAARTPLSVALSVHSSASSGHRIFSSGGFAAAARAYSCASESLSNCHTTRGFDGSATVVAGTSFGINICWNERTGCDCEISIGMSSDGSLSSSSEFVVVDMSVAAESVLGWKWFLGGLKRAASGAGRRSRD